MAQFIPRTSYDNIVLLTDLTSRSNSALSYARAFAQYYDARLTLLHILHKHASFFAGSSVANKNDEEKARAELESIANGLRQAKIDVQVHLYDSTTPSEGILSCLDFLSPNLIIQGTAAIDDPRRAFVGSIAESIFRRSTIPVLTVGSQVTPFMEKALHFDRILFTTNFGSQATSSAIYALSLAEEFGAHVTFCHVHSGRTEPSNKEEIKQQFERALQQRIMPEARDWCNPECLIAFGDVDTEIRRLMMQQRPDLVVAAAHSLGRLGTRARPGTVFKIVANAACPVLTILGAPGRGENPIHPDNLPDTITTVDPIR